MFLCLLSYVSKPSRRAGSLLIFMGVYNLYNIVMDSFFIEVNTLYYFLESLTVFLLVMWVMIKPEINTAKTINKDNILLAFYKGTKGLFIMHFFELFGLPVKSVCIIAGKKALYLKSSKEMFQFGDSETIFRKSDDYVIIDTGKKYDEEFIRNMKSYKNESACRIGLRIRCVEAVADLLAKIGPEWKPALIDNIPGVYLRKCLRN